MNFLDVNFIVNVILNFLTVLLYVASYMYIVNLEEKGCKCAEHRNRSFIKNFSLFAIVYLLITMVIPTGFITNTFGPIVAILYSVVQLIFLVTSIVYFFMALDYTRYLINEKCKCSEDIRREIIMIGSVIEIFFILLLLLSLLIIPVIFAAITTALKNMDKTEGALREAITDPVKSLRKVPNRLGKTTESINKLLKTTTKGVKDIITKKRSKLIKMDALKGKRGKGKK